MTKTLYKLLLICWLAITACSDNIEQNDELEIPVDQPTDEKEEPPVETPTTEPNDPSIFATNLFYTTPSDAIKNNIFEYPNSNNALGDGDDSATLRTEINKVNREGGGVLKIPAGYYYLNNIHLKSNVHLEFDSEAVILPAKDNTKRIFNFGMIDRIENVSISSTNNKPFKVDFTNPVFFNQNLSFIRIGRVDNFKLSDFIINDRRTSLASILISYVPETTETKPWSTNGVIENITQTNSHTGYGLIQGYAGQHLLFKNLECEGGITFRLETDDRAMKEEIKDGAKEGGVKDIFAYDLRGSKGLTTVMLSPHFTQNGQITIDKVQAKGSCFAVRIEHGFLELFDENRQFSTTNDTGRQNFINFIESQFDLPDGTPILEGNPYKRNNGTQWAVRISSEAANATRNAYVLGQLGSLNRGEFQDSNIIGVEAIYTNKTEAKIKQNHLQFLPCNQWSKVQNPTNLGMQNGFEYHGPSLGLSVDHTNNSGTTGNYTVTIYNQTFTGFPSGHIQNIEYDTAPICNSNSFGTITQYQADF
ncbi:hypothetical protein [Ochrovirga pacifica]|uniref:hypothetical protein n=1 Tax=Ochrovirga pacifica TaxID=1042376 RepID=UPI0002559DC5|nr:hypothetical protein [Ochrovirga pacifica]